eukprot:1139297-Pelagomonas_calceolata.AAC.3
MTPSQFKWFCAAVIFYNDILPSNNTTVYGGPRGPIKFRAMFGKDYRGYFTAEELQARQCN